MNDTGSFARLATARVAVLATIRPDGSPHLVPIVFAVDGERLVTAVDHKPKTTPRLRRLANIRANPHVSLLAHGYDEDWSGLWWVRADGTAQVLESGHDLESAISALAAKYSQYRHHLPSGPVVAITVDRIVGWTATGE